MHHANRKLKLEQPPPPSDHNPYHLNLSSPTSTSLQVHRK